MISQVKRSFIVIILKNLAVNHFECIKYASHYDEASHRINLNAVYQQVTAIKSYLQFKIHYG